MTSIPEHEQAWIEQIRQTELELALKKLPTQPVQQVLEFMTHRIVQKILDPLTIDLKENVEVNYDSVKSRQEYLDNYYNKFNRPSDHVS